MKNKGPLLLLSMLVIGIWGFIFYKVVSATTVDDSPTSTISAIPYTKLKYKAELDTQLFTIPVNNPFSFKANESQKIVKHNSTFKQAIPKTTKYQIEYTGFLHNINSNQPIAILKINGRTRLVGNGDIVDGLRVNRISPREILISYNGQQETIKIK